MARRRATSRTETKEQLSRVCSLARSSPLLSSPAHFGDDLVHARPRPLARSLTSPPARRPTGAHSSTLSLSLACRRLVCVCGGVVSPTPPALSPSPRVGAHALAKEGRGGELALREDILWRTSRYSIHHHRRKLISTMSSRFFDISLFSFLDKRKTSQNDQHKLVLALAVWRALPCSDVPSAVAVPLSSFSFFKRKSFKNVKILIDYLILFTKLDDRRKHNPLFGCPDPKSSPGSAQNIWAMARGRRARAENAVPIATQRN